MQKIERLAADMTVTPQSLPAAYLAQVRWLPGSERIAPVHQAIGQQHDNLCGPYWLSILLQAWGASDLDPSHLAAWAGSILPIGDPQQWVPPGAASRQDYTLPLPETAAVSQAGTATQGLIAAVDRATDGAYALVPVQTDWSAEAIDQLLHLCQSHPDWEAVPLCNIGTGYLWGASLTRSQADAYLAGADISPPPADWSVGHFVTLAGVLVGAARSLVVVRDTYPQLGWQGYHLQPPAAIAAALNRTDSPAGGVLLFVAAQQQAAVAQACQQQGWAIAAWDNGTPYLPT